VILGLYHMHDFLYGTGCLVHVFLVRARVSDVHPA
jgi:hypothetical protein